MIIINEEFSTFIRNERKKQKLTITELASIAGMKRDSLKNIEYMVVGASLRSMWKIMTALDVDFAEFQYFLEAQNGY